MNNWEKSEKISSKDKKTGIRSKKKMKKTKQTKKPNKLGHHSEKEERIDKNRKVSSLDFKLARDSMLEEILVSLKNYWL